jgi:hypothetical protein
MDIIWKAAFADQKRDAQIVHRYTTFQLIPILYQKLRGDA